MQQQAFTKSDLKVVSVDTTVPEKAIAFPTDARLYDKARRALVRVAQHRVKLRQSGSASYQASPAQTESLCSSSPKTTCPETNAATSHLLGTSNPRRRTETDDCSSCGLSTAQSSPADLPSTETRLAQVLQCPCSGTRVYC